MSRNTKKVLITVPCEQIAKRANSTPTFKNLSRLTLRQGDNIETVNHFTFSQMLRLYPLLNIKVIEI